MNKYQELAIKNFFIQEQYQNSIEYLENILIDNDDNNLYKIYLALAYFCLDNEEYYQTILLDLLLNSSEFDLIVIAQKIFDIAQIKLHQQNISLAIKLYQQGLEINPQYIPAYTNLAQLFIIQNNLDSAVSLWQELILTQPNLIISYENLGLLWQNIYEYKNAIEIYQQGLNIENDNLNILSNLAYCYLKNNQIILAQESLEKIVIIAPNYTQVYGELGYIYLLQNKLNLSIELWQKLINSQLPMIDEYLNWYSQNIKSSSNNANSIELNRNLIIALKNNNQEEILINIAHLLFNQKNYFLAINYYQQALQKNIESESIYYHLILSLFYTEKIHLIDEYLNKLDRIDKEKSQAISLLINQKKSFNDQINTSFNKPQKYYEKALDWATKKSTDNVTYKKIDLDNILRLKPPKNSIKNLHPSFYFPSTIELPKTFVINTHNGFFYLREDEASSAIITPENYLIGDLSPESPALSPNHPDSHPSKHSIFQTNFLPPIKLIKGTVVVLAGLLNNIYFHWLFDILPRIYLLELAQIDLTKVDYFLVDNRTNYQKETLEIFGIPSDKILPLSLPIYLQASNLIVPSFPGSIAWMPPWSCQYLRDKILENKIIDNKSNKRLYISRNKSSNRRLINEQEIINLLLEYNFEVVNLELLSVKQQGELLSQAEIVISPHGSGLSNLVFCQPTTKVIEIFAPNYVYPCYWLVSNLVNLDYYYLTGEIIGSKHFHQLLYPDSRLEDIYLNCQNLKELLTNIIQ
ncbi:glycosyltransferase 61 family protein [Geminocystis sp. NIES-3709]|uniref:glycosyltransferase 61 family protein n=1 Tax=Geminocystis sp. NIES-3709 TaxID=1617448 RepID=UPI0005FCCFDA|nr:glycosyltransferase 61 family protein [Geminocystis sp. NIES-3709]BAQ66214.1 tetratricopeptide TPR_2 [Geminocystis sp. NIES-3709]